MSALQAADAEPGLRESADQDETDRAGLDPAKQKALAIPAFRGVRVQTLSYVEYATGEKKLYDVKVDPYELQNLASKADPKLLDQLSARMKQLSSCKGAACRTAEDVPFNLPWHFSIREFYAARRSASLEKFKET